MLKNNYTPIYRFASFMMEKVIPHDTRLASLAKERDFKRYSEYFHVLERCLHSEYDLDNLEYELTLLAFPLYDTYTINLLDKFQDIFSKKEYDKSTKTWDKLHSRLKKLSGSDKTTRIENEKLFQDYEVLCNSLEKSLNIERVQLPKRENLQHISSNIYNVDYHRLLKVYNQVLEALDYLYFELKKHPEMHTQKDRTQELDYLIKVVNFELWNFLSHLCHANSDFYKTPLTYISDLEKASNHLRRAIMDIYDGLIIDIYSTEITPEYLVLRNQKIMSLGQSRAMSSLSKDLREYYLKIRS